MASREARIDHLADEIHDVYEAIAPDLWGGEAPDEDEFVDVMRDKLQDFLEEPDYRLFSELSREQQDALIRGAY